MEDTRLSSVLQNFFNPTFLPNFHYPFESNVPVVYIHRSETAEPEEFPLDAMFPFMTIQDIKTFIYFLKGQDNDYHPSLQALLIPFGSELSSAQTEEYIPLDYAFTNVDKKGRILSTYQLLNPFKRAKAETVDKRFVDENGNRRILKIANRSDATMEELFADLFAKNIRPTFHLFLLNDVLQYTNSETIATNREWNGRIYPYYPEITQNYEAEIEDEREQQFLNAKVSYVEAAINITNDLDNLINTRFVALKSITMSSVKFLRLYWKKPQTVVPDIQTLFYQMPTSYPFPFLRLLPYQGIPITKLYVDSPLRIPSFDPRLVKQWADQKPLTKNDFLFGKVMMRDKVGEEAALFSTLRVFDDRSADFILQPPKNLKKIMLSDIYQFPSYLQASIKDSYLENAEVEIGEAAIVCHLSEIGTKQISKKKFLQRLVYFNAFFQEIPLLPNEQATIMLRYRAVSKFTAEDKIFTFLTQYNSRLIANGTFNAETYANDMIQALMYEFKIRFKDAKDIFVKWNEEKGKITLNVAETKDFVLQYNKGIDIAVFAQQSSYSFHLYRVSSTLHLRRILTALSLLLSASDDAFVGLEEEAGDLQDALSVKDEEEKEEEVGNEDFSNQKDGAFGADLGLYGEDYDEDEQEEEIELVAKLDANQQQQQQEQKLVVEQVKPLAKPKPAENFTKPKSFREYFTKKLYDEDQELFPKIINEKGKETQPYSTKCQAIDDRQPNILTELQYESMKDIYRDDDITFLEFPLKQDVKPVASGEIVPVLKYGSSNLKLNYYVCCKYFCTRDYIMVLEKEFEEGIHYRPPRMDAQNKEIFKEKGSCPFCGGKLISDKSNPGPNEWVYRRKDGNNRYVGLLHRTVHPKGWFQPCCFGNLPKYRATDKQFERLQYVEPVKQEIKDKPVVQQPQPVKAPEIAVSYSFTLSKAHLKYIVERNKFPLEIASDGSPQIGLLLPILDSYFQQDYTAIVHKPSQKQELKPNSKAFLRVAVDNSTRGRADSFFSAIAPFLLVNSADDVRRLIKNRIDPRNFLFMNYGNLLLEFYNSSDADPETPQELNTWVEKSAKLQVEITGENRDALVRLFKSYHRFMEFLDSKTTVKEYRQFAQMVAMPGFLTERGVAFIVLDIVKDGDSERLEVRCPPYGIDNETFADVDIGFLLHHYSGAWEPIFYIENKQAYKQFGETHEPMLTFQRADTISWPDIVQKRITEFTQKCSGPGRAAWTSRTAVDPYALISVGRALQTISQSPEGVVRDSYNHIVALTFRYEAGKSRLVAVPVVDDGTIITPANIHFDWTDYKAASIDQVIRFYQENIDPFFSYYPGYTIENGVKELSTNKVVAVQLKNGIYIPCLPIKDDADEASKRVVDLLPYSTIKTVKEIEWAINRDIIFGKETTDTSEILLKSSERDLNEAFEYLRLTFSNWFSSDEVSGDLREKVERVIFSKTLPLFEKRKRLEIIMGSDILKWMVSGEAFRDEQKSLLRVDCRLTVQDKCTGMCIWKEDESRCAIHVPKDENELFVSVPFMLMRRLLEELIRFPERRRQLLEKQVSPLVSLKQAVLIDNQYIIPESSLAWYDLMHKDWMETGEERKKFYEEISSVSAEIVRAPPSNENAQRGSIPASLKEFLGIETEQYYLYRPEIQEGFPSSILPFLVSMGVFPSDLGLDDEYPYELSEEDLRKLVLLTRRPVIQINMVGEEVDFDTYKTFGPAKREKDPTPMVLIIQDLDLGGPAMLSLSPTAPIPIPKEKMSSGLDYLYDAKTLVKDS